MFVQEEKIFAGKVLKVHVCTLEGTEWLEEVTDDTTIEKLKEKCLKHYVHGSLEDPKTLTHHKLIHAATERILTESKTVAEENLKDNDCLLLIKKRPPLAPQKMTDVSAEEKKHENKAPDKDAILKATANLSTRNTDRTVTQHNIRDFQTELRKILVSLIEVAQKLLALNPDAVELFKKANVSGSEHGKKYKNTLSSQRATLTEITTRYNRGMQQMGYNSRRPHRAFKPLKRDLNSCFDAFNEDRQLLNCGTRQNATRDHVFEPPNDLPARSHPHSSPPGHLSIGCSHSDPHYQLHH
ncbi:putative ubiquitin-associated domain-containing protein 1 [Triplophysa rosa]|uniref:Ubiquitin-associated domain-containing protein 1 n=1 Tax=Triplophysa rosa TaxID=992332 RepID=A0A9W7X239_TRIRA|nr:putative ubiquitin-associated domain-containing protein 1 [Triplophysa rosa]